MRLEIFFKILGGFEKLIKMVCERWERNICLVVVLEVFRKERGKLVLRKISVSV